MRLVAIGIGAVLVGASSAGAESIVLTFEGLKQGEQVLDFYNGGTGSLGSSGTDFGVAFTSEALALTHGNYAGEPSAPTVMFLSNGVVGQTGQSRSIVMSVPAGFGSSLTFYYSAIDAPGSVSIYSDLTQDASALLATQTLPITPAIPSGKFSPFVFQSVSFSGMAESVVFKGPDNQIAFDDIAFSRFSPVPEPSTVLLLTLGAGGLLLWRGCGRTAVSRSTPS
jgi:hypothetical protein